MRFDLKIMADNHEEVVEVLKEIAKQIEVGLAERGVAGAYELKSGKEAHIDYCFTDNPFLYDSHFSNVTHMRQPKLMNPYTLET